LQVTYPGHREAYISLQAIFELDEPSIKKAKSEKNPNLNCLVITSRPFARHCFIFYQPKFNQKLRELITTNLVTSPTSSGGFFLKNEELVRV